MSDTKRCLVQDEAAAGTSNGKRHKETQAETLEGTSLVFTSCSSENSRGFSTSRSISNNSYLTGEDRSKGRLPMMKTNILRYYFRDLTIYERKEIEYFEDVWYIGLRDAKIQFDFTNPFNGGYDDDEGNYVVRRHDHLMYRYEILHLIGCGSFGKVVRALDHKNDENVAIKILNRHESFDPRRMMEFLILKQLLEKDKDDTHNIIHVKSAFTFREHTCIVFELMNISLRELCLRMYSLPLHQIRLYATSILRCLKLLSAESIIHCDLKPENIVLNENHSILKVIDFGSSCYAGQMEVFYVQTRYYRAPEILFCIPYGPPVDVWSLGCILAELYIGRPLFLGRHNTEQIAFMMEALGVPPIGLIEKSPIRDQFFDDNNEPHIDCITNTETGLVIIPGTYSLEDILNCPDPSFSKFIKRCLDWDPSERITPTEALEDDWILNMSKDS